MVKRGTVVLGMSGGVDSSVAAALLVEQGYHVRGVTLQVWEHEDDSVAASKRWQERGCCKIGLARHVAKLLDIPHNVIDTRESFKKGVVDDFIHGYVNGTTPNPCVRCNERVKFGSLYHLAKSMGADYVATGHYARLHPVQDGTMALLKATDSKKDQSYFLYRLPSSWLSHILFPLGSMVKSEIWRRAEAMGLPTEELKESQEICFVTQGSYREFIKVNHPDSVRPGSFVTTKGIPIGQHDGIAFYTPGQRKGLGVATGERLYVQRVIPETNTVVLGSHEELISWECTVSELNLFDGCELADGDHVEVKIRYACAAVPAVLRWIGPDVLTLRFLSPQGALSPGQSAVFYQGDRVVGGGIIQPSQVPPSQTEHCANQAALPLTSSSHPSC